MVQSWIALHMFQVEIKHIKRAAIIEVLFFMFISKQSEYG